MTRADNHKDLLDGLAKLNPVHEDDLAGLIPDPFFDSMPSQIMTEGQAGDSGRPSGRMLWPRSIGNALAGALAPRSMFVMAICGVAVLLVSLNLLLSDHADELEQTGLEEVASPAEETVALDRPAINVTDGNGVAEELPGPAAPVGPDVPATSSAQELASSAEAPPSPTTTVPDPPTTSTLTGPPSEAAFSDPATTTTTQPSLPVPTTADSPPPPAPCSAGGPSLVKAIAAYRTSCSQPRADCDPVGDSDAWVCSSEIIGVSGPDPDEDA